MIALLLLHTGALPFLCAFSAMGVSVLVRSSPGFLPPVAPPARRILHLQILAFMPLSIFFGP